MRATFSYIWLLFLLVCCWQCMARHIRGRRPVSDDSSCSDSDSSSDENVGTCMDRKRNQDETDVDCGGEKCNKCADRRKCLIDCDCMSNICKRGRCACRPTEPITTTTTTTTTTEKTTSVTTAQETTTTTTEETTSTTTEEATTEEITSTTTEETTTTMTEETTSTTTEEATTEEITSTRTEETTSAATEETSAATEETTAEENTSAATEETTTEEITSTTTTEETTTTMTEETTSAATEETTAEETTSAATEETTAEETTSAATEETTAEETTSTTTEEATSAATEETTTTTEGTTTEEETTDTTIVEETTQLPACDPPCQNGGTCIGLNECECTDDFTGETCSVQTAGLCTDAEGFDKEPILRLTFEQGSAQFSDATPTQLGFRTTYRQRTRPTVEDGYFSFVNSVYNHKNAWHTNATDHTGDQGGYMYLVNADFKPGQFYSGRVDNLCVGLRYEFSVYLANLCKPAHKIDPNVRFEVRSVDDDTLLAVRESGDVPESETLTWERYGFSFNATDTSVRLLMISNAAGGVGNDLVIDDIALRVCAHKGSGFCRPQHSE